MQIYMIVNLINGKIYIGKDEKNRKNYLGSGLLIKRAIKFYGRDYFKKYILEEVEDKKTLVEKEVYWIKYFRCTNRNIGYNITSGGEGGDTLTNHPDLFKIRQKIKDRLKGRVFSENHLEKLRENHPRLKLRDKNMDYEKWLANIRQAHSLRKGKTLEEIVGSSKAKKIKTILREKRKERNLDCCQPVEQYNKLGEFIGRYESQQQASKITGIRQGDISNCIQGRQKTAKGFTWIAIVNK